MLHWWSILSWSHAVIAVLIAWIGLCAWVAGINYLRPRLGGNRRAIPPRRRNDAPLTNYMKQRKSPSAPWTLVDYSAQYREKSDWLGEDGLLATPATRIRQGSHEVGRVVQFERKGR